MVLLTTTPTILSLISNLPPSTLSSLDLPSSSGSPIDHKTLITLSRLAKTHFSGAPSTSSPPSLNSLLQGSCPYSLPPPPKLEPSRQYLALKASLLRQQEQREYNELLRRRQQEDDQTEDSNGEDNIPVSLPFNILLSILLCGGAVFYMTRYWNNDGLRVLLSLLTGIVVGIAEVVVYAGYLRKVKESKRIERRKREVKQFIGVVGDETIQQIVKSDQRGEKEEVWGRGVNGGARRRVREKWEKKQARAY